MPKGWKKVRHNFQRHVTAAKKPGSPNPDAPKYDPDEYLHAKKSLKKAVLECYRCVFSLIYQLAVFETLGVLSGLEVLENYRVRVFVFLVGGVLRRLWWLDVEPHWVPQSPEEV